MRIFKYSCWHRREHDHFPTVHRWSRFPGSCAATTWWGCRALVKKNGVGHFVQVFDRLEEFLL
jgi:hypothetical protein